MAGLFLLVALIIALGLGLSRVVMVRKPESKVNPRPAHAPQAFPAPSETALGSGVRIEGAKVVGRSGGGKQWQLTARVVETRDGSDEIICTGPLELEAKGYRVAANEAVADLAKGTIFLSGDVIVRYEERGNRAAVKCSNARYSLKDGSFEITGQSEVDLELGGR